MNDSKAFYRGCLLGGAVADALSYPVESLSREEIAERFGRDGISGPVVSETTGKSLISDATQLTIFTVDGLLWADSRVKRKGIYAFVPCIFYAYQKWFFTQTGHFADDDYEFLLKGEVLEWEQLFARRSPDPVVLEALAGSIRNKYGTLRNRINASRSGSAVARSGPVGMYFMSDPEKAFQVGAEAGALTHGHPDAFLAAGAYAAMIAFALQGEKMDRTVDGALGLLRKKKEGKTVADALERALEDAGTDRDPDAAFARMGEGKSGDEALARGVFCALRHDRDFERAVLLAANQTGSSGDPAAIAGGLLGASLGSLEIPYPWIRDVELSDLLVQGADRLLTAIKEERQ